MQNNLIFLDSIVNLKKNPHHRTFHLKVTVTATEIDSSHESGRNVCRFHVNCQFLSLSFLGGKCGDEDFISIS
jgi:hypothetical protein